jgi:hypothetical protein
VPPGSYRKRGGGGAWLLPSQELQVQLRSPCVVCLIKVSRACSVGLLPSMKTIGLFAHVVPTKKALCAMHWALSRAAEGAG